MARNWWTLALVCAAAHAWLLDIDQEEAPELTAA
jgi:hypothetical protein